VLTVLGLHLMSDISKQASRVIDTLKLILMLICYPHYVYKL